MSKFLNRLSLASITLIISSIHCAVANDEYRSVGNAEWYKSKNYDIKKVINENPDDNEVNLFFIRKDDKDHEQLSANIAINDRFQVSLQPGKFTKVETCVGVNAISAEATGWKTNDLLLNVRSFNLKPNNNYFFYIDVDNKGHSSIEKINEDDFLKMTENKNYQSHQISRVVKNCKIQVPNKVTEKVSMPVLEEKIEYELKVLFDTDKAIIKSEYQDEIEGLVKLLKTYGNSNVVIEGHTDSRASKSYNQKLSEKRAEAVKTMLVGIYGIDPERIETVGYGELKPVASNETTQGMKQNRRIIAVLSQD